MPVSRHLYSFSFWGAILFVIVLTLVQFGSFFELQQRYSYKNIFESSIWPTPTQQRNGTAPTGAVAKEVKLLQSNTLTSRPYSDHTAVYFDINHNSYGILSTSNSSQPIADVLRASDTLWIRGNWGGLPKNKSIVMNIIREKKLEHINMTVKLLITESSDTGSGFYAKGFPLHRVILTVSKLLGSNNVHIATRKLVAGRNFRCFINTTMCSTKTFLGDVNGTVIDYRNRPVVNHIHNGVVAKWDFGVREEYLEIYDTIVREKLDLKDDEALSSSDFANYERVRVKDVAYLWEETNDGMSYFRGTVTRFMRTVILQHNLTGLVGLVSPRAKVGRTTTSNLYASALLEHKIIVLAQRDGWEDHLRLCESLSAGALVLTDPITFPPAGLVDGKNIVFYTSLEDLAKKVMYYLKDEKGCIERDHIAKAGRQLVLSHQRGHHRYERLMLRDNWPKNWTNPVAPLL